MQFTVAPARTGHLVVDGCPIAWARWGPSAAQDGRHAGDAGGDARPGGAAGEPPIVLVHGASAHLGWWDAVIARLVARRPDARVIGLELSGHGDSGHRDDYSGEIWAAEVLAVMREIGGAPGRLVGHSLGGRIAVLAAAREPALVPHPVLVDASLATPGARRAARVPARPTGSSIRTVHPTLDTAVDAFRLRPREPVADTALLGRIAAGAYRREGEGWVLRADLSVFHRIPDEGIADALRRLEQPLTVIYGTASAVVDRASLDLLVATHLGATELVALDGHHHLPIDQAAELTEALLSIFHDSCL